MAGFSFVGGMVGGFLVESNVIHVGPCAARVIPIVVAASLRGMLVDQCFPPFGQIVVVK